LENYREQAGKTGSDTIYEGTVNAMTQRLNRYLKSLDFNYTSHDFRHTKVSELAASGLHTKAVQMYVGHADAATTMRYIHIDEE